MDINKCISDFIVKSKDCLKDLDQNLESFKKSSDDMQSLDKMQSIIKTLKNMSGVINIAGFDNIHKLTGNIENLLDSICKGEIKVTPEVITNLSNCVNDLKGCVGKVSDVDINSQEIGKTVINKLGNIINDKILSK